MCIPTSASRANLRVETHAHATRILFEGKRAVGVEYQAGQGDEADPRPPRSDRRRRRLPVAAIVDAVRRRRRCRAWPSTALPIVHHLPGVGQNLQDHPDFVFGYMSDNPNFVGLSVRRLPPAVARHPAIPARAARPDDLEFRRMRRLPENPARPRRARHPAAFRHGDARRSRPQAPPRHRLFLPCLPVAAEEPRQRLARQRRSVWRRRGSIRISSAMRPIWRPWSRASRPRGG